jgi:dynactin 1
MGLDGLCRKLTKRVDDLIEENAALKQHLLPRLVALNDLMPELTNFAIQVSGLLKSTV